MKRRQTANSNTYRFFVPPSAIQGTRVVIEDTDLVHQFTSVLRLRAGDEIVLLDGLGTQYMVQLEALYKRQISGIVTQQTQGGNEPQLQVQLAIGLMRAERLEWLLQKATELGVSAFLPMICERSASDGAIGATKMARWQRIIREAAEQSRRSRLPHVAEPQPFATICTQLAASLSVLLWEGQGATALRQILREANQPATITILSGPEGGFSENERSIAQSQAIREGTLGPRTLRAETAPLVAATMALAEFGELD